MFPLGTPAPVIVARSGPAVFTEAITRIIP